MVKIWNKLVAWFSSEPFPIIEIKDEDVLISPSKEELQDFINYAAIKRFQDLDQQEEPLPKPKKSKLIATVYSCKDPDDGKISCYFIVSTRSRGREIVNGCDVYSSRKACLRDIKTVFGKDIEIRDLDDE